MQFADIGLGAVALRPPKPEDTPGLRWAATAIPAPLGSKVPTLRPSRAALLAFWDDDAAFDRFLGDSPIAARVAGGWSARLEPLRAHGEWPGLDPSISKSRKTNYDGPVAVMTLARTRMPQIVRFMRTSRKAEKPIANAAGNTWATGLAKPPFFATFSLWDSVEAATNYAYGASPANHDDAIHVDRKKPFHHESAFIRFRPYDIKGNLDGKNPL